MNKDNFYIELSKRGIVLNDKQKEQLDKYYKLVLHWNEKINLTSIIKEEDFYKKHFYDSISTSFYFNFNNIKNICDVGSGAGFPSIPLKIVYPHLQVTIIDSLKKRINFLQLLSKELGIEKCKFIHMRAEQAGQDEEYREKYDLVTARAVARLNILAELCLPLVKVGGYFLSLKSQKADEEVEEAKKAFQMLGAKLEKDNELFIEEDKRHILEIKKIKITPKKFPRKAGIPNKNPII